MGITADELNRILTERGGVPATETGGFQRITTTGVTLMSAAPPAGYVNVISPLFINEAVSQVLSQYSNGQTVYPFIQRSSDGPVNWNLASAGAVDFHANVSIQQIDEDLLQPFVVQVAAPGVPTKLFDGPTSPSKGRAAVIYIGAINTFAPSTTVLNTDSNPHDIRYSCSPDNGSTFVTGYRLQGMSALTLSSVGKISVIRAGESIWAEVTQAYGGANPVIFAGLMLDVDA
jgi:hypothetical protein